jgi:hypothetical protein
MSEHKKLDVGIVLIATYSNKNTNHEDWYGKTVFWGKFGWTPNFKETRIIELNDDFSFVDSMNECYRQAIVHRDDVLPHTINFHLLSLSLEFLDWNQGDILQQRQAIALQKLTEDEIEALNMKSLAAYHKLKS